MIRRRMSSLPLARYCGLASTLPSYSGRAAIIGRAYHLKAANDPGYPDAAARLTKEERDLVESWPMPMAVHVTNPVTGEVLTLRYDEALKEQAIGLLETGEDTGYEDEEAMAFGTADAVWWDEASRTLFLGDIKTGEKEIDGGALSLQLLGYAFAFLAQHGASRFACGIWYARENRWDWSEVIEVDSEKAGMLWREVRAAAQAPVEAVRGEHCERLCFSRMHCPAYVLPATQMGTELEPLSTPGGLTKDNVVKAFLTVQALSKVVDAAKAQVKAWVAENGDVPTGDGKALTMAHSTGREYADVAALKADGLTKYLRQAKDSEFPAIRKVR